VCALGKKNRPCITWLSKRGMQKLVCVSRYSFFSVRFVLCAVCGGDCGCCGAYEEEGGEMARAVRDQVKHSNGVYCSNMGHSSRLRLSHTMRSSSSSICPARRCREGHPICLRYAPLSLSLRASADTYAQLSDISHSSMYMCLRLFMHPHIHAHTHACPRAFMPAFAGRVSQAARGSQEAGQVEKGLRRAVTSPLWRRSRRVY
jgi:hypothetical protein